MNGFLCQLPPVLLWPVLILFFSKNNSPYQSPFQALLTHDLIFPALSGNQLVIRPTSLNGFHRSGGKPKHAAPCLGWFSILGYLLEAGYALSFIHEGIAGLGFPNLLNNTVPIYIHL